MHFSKASSLMMSPRNSLDQSSSPRDIAAAASYQAFGCNAELLSQIHPACGVIMVAIGRKIKLAASHQKRGGIIVIKC